MARTYTEEEFERELGRAAAEGRLPQFPGQDTQEEKRNRKKYKDGINTMEIKF